MNSKTRQKVIRRIVSAVLESDISRNDLRDVGQSFLEEKHLSVELGEIFMNLSEMLRGQSVRHRDHQMSDREDLADDILAGLKRKKLSKHEILNVIISVFPRLPNDFAAGNRTIKDSVSFFAENAPIEALYEIASLLDSAKGDEYLNEMLNR